MIDRTKERSNESFLVNNGQNYVDSNLKKFIDSIPDIKTVEDLGRLDQALFGYLRQDNSIEAQRDKFSKSASDIFNRCTFTGCSDIGIIASSILREKGIPTVYVESAEASWLDEVGHGIDKGMRGHIFLEVQLDNQTILYDPSWHRVYSGYDKNNPNLPRGLIAFSKGLNPVDVGVSSIRDERDSALREITDYSYVDPNYQFQDVRDFKKHNNIRFGNLSIFDRPTILNKDGIVDVFEETRKSK